MTKVEDIEKEIKEEETKEEDIRKQIQDIDEEMEKIEKDNLETEMLEKESLEEDGLSQPEATGSQEVREQAQELGGGKQFYQSREIWETMMMMIRRRREAGRPKWSEPPRG